MMFMMKKKIMGIPIALLLVVTLASGALVAVLSDQTTSQVSVQSPLDLDITGATTNSVNGAVSFTDNTVTADVYGGETIITTGQLTNLANATITGVRTEIEFSGLTDSSEVDSIVYEDTNGAFPLSLCEAGGLYYAYIGPSGGFDVNPGHVGNSNVSVTFNQAASGTYTSTTSVIDLAQTSEKC